MESGLSYWPLCRCLCLFLDDHRGFRRVSCYRGGGSDGGKSRQTGGDLARAGVAKRLNHSVTIVIAGLAALGNV